MQKIVGYLGLFMSLFFIGSGLFIAIKQLFPAPHDIFSFEFTYFKDHPEQFNYLVGGILIVYGVFRLIRSMRILKSPQV